MALVTNGTVASVNDCAALLFTDTTGVYNSGTNPTGFGTPNPNYTDIATVTFKLYNSLSVLVGTANVGWIPDYGTPLNTSLYLFPSDFGLTGSTFDNDTYSMDYVITMKNEAVYTKNITSIDVQCPPAVYQCPYDYEYYNFVMDTVSGNYGSTTTVTSIRVAGVTITSTNTTPITSRAVLLTVLADIIATSGQNNYLTQYTTFVGNGTYGVDMVNFYGVQGGYNIVFNINGTPTTIGCSAKNVHASEQYISNRVEVGFSCDAKNTIILKETSGFWNDGQFPDYVDLVFPMQFCFEQDHDPATTFCVSIDENQFYEYITDGIAIEYPLGDWPNCVVTTFAPAYILKQNGQDVACYTKDFILSACGATKTSDLVVKTSATFGCDCSYFTFCDTTGNYDSILNTTGYGNSATALYADIYNTTLQITSLATGSSITLDNGFIPSAIGDNCFNVSVTDIMSITGSMGLTNIPDTIYKCVYNVYNACDQLLGTSTLYVRFTCNLQNCIDQRGAALVTGCCTTDSAAEKDFLQNAIFNLQMIQNPAIPNNQMDCIAKKLENISQQCVFGCPTCN